MMQESLTGKKLKEEEKKLAQDIQKALDLQISISGAKKVMLQNQYDGLLSQFYANVKLAAKEFNSKTKAAISDFIINWNIISQELAEKGDLITSDRVGNIDFKSYQEALASSK